MARRGARKRRHFRASDRRSENVVAIDPATLLDVLAPQAHQSPQLARAEHRQILASAFGARERDHAAHQSHQLALFGPIRERRRINEDASTDLIGAAVGLVMIAVGITSLATSPLVAAGSGEVAEP